MASAGRRPEVVAAVWAVVVFLLTGLAVAVLWMLGVNLQTLGPSSPNVGPAFAAIELTAYAPTLSALLVAWLAARSRGRAPAAAAVETLAGGRRLVRAVRARTDPGVAA